MEALGPLHELARLYDLELSYHDVYGHLHHATEPAIRAVLRSLGAELSEAAGGEAEVAAALTARRRALAREVLEPVHVAWDGALGAVRLRLPAGQVQGRFRVSTLETAQGEAPQSSDAQPRLLAEGDLEGLPVLEVREIDDERYLDLDLKLGSTSGPLALGVGELRVELPTGEIRATTLSAPLRAWQPEAPRQWGVFCPTYALRGARPGGDVPETGAGDLGDLGALVSALGPRGCGFVGTLPLLATFLEGALFEPSPYAPVSRLFFSELFLDLAALLETQPSEEAQSVVEGAGFGQEAAALRQAEHVDYRREIALRRSVLERLARECFAEPSPARAALESWTSQNPRVKDYAAFRAVTERRGVGWREWPTELRDTPDALPPGEYDEGVYRYHLYVQWRLAEQLEGLGQRARSFGTGLYLDLPLGVHSDGYDLWRERERFCAGVAAGAPPDPLFSGGQSWGLPPLHPGAIRQGGYRYVRSCLDAAMRYAGALRIDHVMGLLRVFFVPHGMSAKEGVYVRYRLEEMMALLTLASHRHRTVVIGEDLGTVPDAVREAMHRHGLFRMWVGQMEAAPERPPAYVGAPPDSIASLNTHDTPTFAGYLAGTDIDVTESLGLLESDAAQDERARRAATVARLRRQAAGPRRGENEVAPRDLLGQGLTGIAASEAALVMVNLEDLWLESEPQNVPGTSSAARPNWRRRLRRSLSEALADPEVGALLGAVGRARRAHAPARPPEPRAAPPPGALDVHLFNEGTHERLYAYLGAHAASEEGEAGTRFAVWAPQAVGVSVIGDFNGWRHEQTPLAPLATSGVWVGFVPGASSGALYKYAVAPHGGGPVQEKQDPFAFRFEVPPRTASMVWDLDYAWGDEAFMAERDRHLALDRPVSIYEVHLGSWLGSRGTGGEPSYRELALKLAAHVTRLGFTHVELLPISEHPFYGSWGYQCTGYFAPTARYGTPQDLMAFVDILHQHGIGVILDWVPAHFPRDTHSLACFDGTSLYEHADPRQGLHPDWDTAIFNYGRREVRSFLLSSAMFWLERFHIDGLRIDAVASMLYLDYSREAGEWVPNVHGGHENLEAVSFLQHLNTAIYRRFPGVQTIAEESTAWPRVSRPIECDGLGFGLKWDLGWMHDTLEYFATDPLFRKHQHDKLTFRGLYAFDENFVLPLSHDEVVHLKGSLLQKMPGDAWQRLANLRLLYAYQFALPGKKLLFMGAELATPDEWCHERGLRWELLGDPAHAGIAELLAALNRVYRDEPALSELDCDPAGFRWIEVHDDEHSVLAFERHAAGGGAPVVVAFNFTPVPRYERPIGVDRLGRWREVLNTDATSFGGSGLGNLGGLPAHHEPAQGRPYSLRVTLPPLAAVFFSPG
ncbi:MAG: 1,4-alpha-glucan branching protein GlgB [Planctomycetota bacterium]